jgi:hypothetical protein
LIKNLSYLHSLTVDKIVKLYEGKNYYCGKDKFIYDYKDNKVYPCYCNRLTCEACRKIIKWKLYLMFLACCLQFNIENHYVITAEGEKYRNNVSIYQTFVDLTNTWNKIRKKINYWYFKKFNKEGKFTYIILFRAQKSGVCHIHILTNLNISKIWLEQSVKNYSDIGFVKKGKNENPVAYLCFDFFKEHEWYIPPNIRHYSSSRDIKFNFGKSENIDRIFYKHSIKLNKFENLEAFNKKIMEKFNCCLPFETWLKYFISLDCYDNSKEIVFSDLKESCDYNKKHNDYYYKIVGYKNVKNL